MFALNKISFVLMLGCLSVGVGACSDDDGGKDKSQETGSEPGTEQPGTEQPGTEQPGTQEPENRTVTVEEAIAFNEARALPIRFVLKLKQVLDIDIDRSSLAKAVKFNRQIIEKLSELQEGWFGQSRFGLIDAETLLKIESDLFEEDGIHWLIGMYTSADAVILEGLSETNEVSESVYLRCKDIIESYGGFFDTTSNYRNLLAIRGAVIDGDKIKRTNTADMYINHIDEPEPNPQNTIHFASGIQLNPASGLVPYDDTMLTIWKETSGGSDKFFVQAVPLNTDPGMQGGNTGGYTFDGTAHLRDGQYIGVIWRHSTSMFNHAQAVLNACYEDSAAFDVLTPEARNSNGAYVPIVYEELENWVNLTELPRIRYGAMNNVYNKKTYNGNTIAASGTSEVIRDFRTNQNASDGIISRQELNTARKVLANLYPSDEQLAAVYPDMELNDALDQWFQDFFVAYTEDECQNLFGMPSSVIYSDDSQQLRAGLFKNAYIRYRDTAQDIGINIHTSPDYETSSQGCLNIPISHYPSFLTVLSDVQSQSSYLYTLVDASKIRGKGE